MQPRGDQQKRNRRPDILRSAEKLFRERGLNGVTTRAIAATVPCSEGAIYVHFGSRAELLVAVLQEALPSMLVPLQALENSVGKETVARNLLSAVKGLQAFHQRTAPMLASLFSEPALLSRFQVELAKVGSGPQGAITRLATYVRSEQRLGRISDAIDPETFGSVLVSSCFFYVFAHLLTGHTLSALKPSALVSHLLAHGNDG